MGACHHVFDRADPGPDGVPGGAVPWRRQPVRARNSIRSCSFLAVPAAHSPSGRRGGWLVLPLVLLLVATPALVTLGPRRAARPSTRPLASRGPTMAERRAALEAWVERHPADLRARLRLAFVLKDE